MSGHSDGSGQATTGCIQVRGVCFDAAAAAAAYSTHQCLAWPGPVVLDE